MGRWTTEIDRITAQYLYHFGNLTDEELNWKPDPRTWSIAQNINHVITLNSSYFTRFEEVKAGRNKLPFIARFGFLVNFFGNTIKKFSTPDRKRKTGTFGRWEQVRSDFTRDILTDFQHHQALLKRYSEEMEFWADKNAMITSPASDLIVFKVKTVFEIIIPHEERHCNQAQEVLNAMPVDDRT